MRISDFPRSRVTALLVFLGLLTLIALVVSAFPKPQVPPTVSTTSPSNGEEDALGILPIVITFEKELTQGQQEEIAISSQPQVSFSSLWQEGQRLQLTPRTALAADTTYTNTVTFKEKPIYTFSFKTVATSAEVLAEELQQQTEGDLLFAEEERKFYQENPWYSKLPIVTTDYTIVYDFEKTAFRIRLTLPTGSTDAKIAQTKLTSLQELGKIGVDPTSEGYYFLPE